MRHAHRERERKDLLTLALAQDIIIHFVAAVVHVLADRHEIA
jgi:hypothetical protein